MHQWIKFILFWNDTLHASDGLFDICLLMSVQSRTPDDGRKDRPKHVECHSKLNKFDPLMHLVDFTMEIMLRCTALWTSDLLVAFFFLPTAYYLEGNRFWLCEVFYMHYDWLCKYRLICVAKEHPDQWCGRHIYIYQKVNNKFRNVMCSKCTPFLCVHIRREK